MALTAEQQAMDFNPELQDVTRQRKLAELLMSQGLDQPQGQMISGHYVAPSWAQQLNPMFKAIVGTSSANKADTQEAKLAEALRTQKGEALSTFQELMAKPETRGQAMKFAASNRFLQPLAAKLAEGMKLSEGEKFVMPGMNGQSVEVASGGQKLHSVDGNLVDSQGNLVFKAPKVFAPHASQLVPTATGFAEYNPNTRTLIPVGGGQSGAMGAANAPTGTTGASTGALMPPLPAHLQKEVTETNQQTSIINDAIKGVEANRKYFGGKYAAPELLGGEIGQAAMNAKLPEGAVEARSNVFNTASAVIKERAGTAQTPSEKTIIMRFLPSIYDGDAVVIRKLNAYNKYIANKAAGTTAVPGAIPTYQGQATQNPVAPAQNRPQETPGSWGKATIVGG